jgi:hypothetical protein
MESSQSKRSYRRDDGVLMIEVRPGEFVNERVASLLKSERIAAGTSSRRKGRRIQTDVADEQ